MSRHGQLFRSVREPNRIIVTGNIAKIIIMGRSAEIMAVATIDTDDVEKCKAHKWRFHTSGYIMTVGLTKNSTLFLHTLITGIKLVDHANRDKTDNRKENLRPCSESQNQANRRLTANRHQYKGVREKWGKWEAWIGHKTAKLYLGRFSTPAEAAMTYNKKAVELFGEFARLNIIQEDVQL